MAKISPLPTGTPLPESSLKAVINGEITDKTVNDLFHNKNVILFGVPGAFTPLCSNSHLPSFLENYDQLKAKGIDQIVCLAVNDAFVLQAWAKTSQVEDKIIFIADGNGHFTKKLGLQWDGSDFHMGLRSKRFVMTVLNGVIKDLQVEETPGSCTVSNGENVLKRL